MHLRQTDISKLPGIDASILPPSLQELVLILELPPTLRLVEHVGGTGVFVPTTERCKPEHQLARIVGFAALLKLAEARGGEYIEIPRAASALRAVRDNQIKALYPSKSQRELALLFGLTERQIRNILGDQVADEKQQELFS